MWIDPRAYDLPGSINLNSFLNFDLELGISSRRLASIACDMKLTYFYPG